MSSSGVSPSRSRAARRPRRREAELEQPVAARAPRVVVRRRRDAIAGRRSGLGADLLAQLDDDPLGRALADARHGLQPRVSPAATRATSSRGEPPLRTAERDLRARRTARRCSSRKRSRSSSVAKP
jgi:hypothetical protein